MAVLACIDEEHRVCGSIFHRAYFFRARGCLPIGLRIFGVSKHEVVAALESLALYDHLVFTIQVFVFSVADERILTTPLIEESECLVALDARSTQVTVHYEEAVSLSAALVYRVVLVVEDLRHIRHPYMPRPHDVAIFVECCDKRISLIRRSLERDASVGIFYVGDKLVIRA